MDFGGRWEAAAVVVRVITTRTRVLLVVASFLSLLSFVGSSLVDAALVFATRRSPLTSFGFRFFFLLFSRS